jgi:hypothetical protein
MNPRRLAILLVLAPTALGCASAQSITGDSDPDMVEVRSYPLSLDKVQKLADAIDALSQLEATNPALKAKMDAEPNDDQTIDQKVYTLDAKFPQAADVVHQNGLTSRDYIMVSLACLNDVAFVAMKRQGSLQAYPPGSITPQNAAFVEANYNKLQQLSQKMSGSPE